jgi:hypothetical protein
MFRWRTGLALQCFLLPWDELKSDEANAKPTAPTSDFLGIGCNSHVHEPLYKSLCFPLHTPFPIC